MLMDSASYTPAFLAKVLCRLLPEKITEQDVFGDGLYEAHPRQAALRVIKKVTTAEISGTAFGNALYWALHLLRKIHEHGQLLPAMETASMVGGLNGALVDFFGEIDELETAMNYEFPDPEEETQASHDYEWPPQK
ncbi:MAG: hypothetical protein HYV53_03140 [Parcubacteria group bacterium]|nr:hypothetical protein [Parcubacteria group bacterium]